MKNFINKSLLGKCVFAGLGTLAFVGCDLKDQLVGTGSKGKNTVAVATKSCKDFKTEAQADGENKVTQPTGEYKFNLYYKGTESKITFWEDKMVDENVVFDFKNPLILYVLDKNNAEKRKVVCNENKANAKDCITGLESMLKMVKESRASIAARGAALSEGKGFTYKCTEEFANGQITELKKI